MKDLKCSLTLSFKLAELSPLITDAFRRVALTMLKWVSKVMDFNAIKRVLLSEKITY